MAADIRLLITIAALFNSFSTQLSYDLAFTESPEDSFPLPGDSVYFSCQTNLPKSQEQNITWYHNKQPFPYQPKANKGHLTFKVSTNPEIFSKQIGTYQCIAGPVGSSYRVASEEADLNIAYLNDFPPAKDEILEIFEGNDIVIPCQTPESIPPPFIQFEKNGQIIVDSKLEGKVINGDTLLLINATKDDTGNYSCIATNHITNERKEAPNIIRLLVHEKTLRNEKSRLIHRPKDNYEVNLGENVFLPCSGSGVPKPQITWTKMTDGGGHFASSPSGNGSALLVQNGILSIKNANQSDTAHYMCVLNGPRRFVRRTSVTVLVPPVLVETPDKVIFLNEDSRLKLKCQASGTPPPTIEWLLNGVPMDQNYVNSITGELVIPLVQEKEQSGYYQCFARNKAGIAHYTTFVQVRRASQSSLDEYDLLEESVIKNYNGFVITSPTRPNVSQVSTESVVIKWDMDAPFSTDPVIPIKFFKLQFREFFRGKGRSTWHTMEEVIDPEVRAFEILGLHTDRKYRFRVVVVFDNNDQRFGPLSKKFRLNTKDLSLSPKYAPKPKPPSQSPDITRIYPLSPTSLRIGWVLNSDPEEIEGYFIFFKPTMSDEKLKKITILGATTHSHVIEALIPGAEYEVKISSFNLSGASPTSNSTIKSTLPLPPLPSYENDIPEHAISAETTSSKTQEDDKMDTNDKIIKYLILGGSLGIFLVFFILVCAIVNFCQRKKKAAFQNTCDAGHNMSEIHNNTKYNDTAREISNHQSFSNLDSRMAKSNQSFLLSSCSTKEILHGGSSSHFEMTLIPDGPGKATNNKNYSVSDSMFSSGHNSNLEVNSLGHEEYNSSPVMWKRSRQGELSFI